MQTKSVSTIQPVTDLRDMLLSRKESAPDKIAFRYHTDEKNIRDVSFFIFAQEVESLANLLLSRGFNGKHIAIFGMNSYEWLLAFFAVTTSGNVAVAINNKMDAEELKKLLLQSDSEAIFCSRKKYEDLTVSLDDDDFHIVHFPFESIISKDTVFPENGLQPLYSDVEIDIHAPASIFFTSGTSGESKAVILSHSGIVSVINSYIEISKEDETVLSVLPFYHALGLICGLIMFFASANTVFINTEAKNLLDDIKESSANLICVVPAHLEFIQKRIENTVKRNKATRKLKYGRRICRLFSALGIELHRTIFKEIHSQFGNNLKTFITGGAPINDTTVKFYQDIGFNVFSGYGLTECSPVVSIEMPDARKLGSCGRPLSCCSVRIAEDGEVFVKGNNLFLGYYKDEQLTQEVMVDGEFATGDIGHLDEDGYLFITGRKKNLIILSNGENISPEEIEMQLLKAEGVQEVVVVEKNNQIVALVFPTEEYRTDKKHFQLVRDRYNKQVPMTHQIADIEIRTSEFGKNSSNKILRDKIEI